MAQPISSDKEYQRIQGELIALVQAARDATTRRVNSLMSATYWEIGRRIVEIEQAGTRRADYGEGLIERLAVDLTKQLGRGFSSTNLKQMRSFHLTWPADRIRQTVSDESSGALEWKVLTEAFLLPWSAYVRLLTVKNDKARQFYEMEALRAGWSVRQLNRQISSQFYERAALSKNKADMLRNAESSDSTQITPREAIRDPFMLEFLDLKDEYSESDLEEALIHRLTDFLMELGDDFAFIGRQRRLRLDNTWFRVDLVFFHGRLKALLIIDLKVGAFSHADAGQMHMYLNYAREHWMKPGENPPVGLVLCAEKGAAEAHYSLEGLSNKVLAAEYQTVLPNEALLADELTRTQQALERQQRDSSFDSN